MKKSCFFLLLLLLASCEKNTPPESPKDPCENVTCLNGGACVDGSCNCPTAWTGPDCSWERIPQKMKYGKIKITAFPPTDNGAGWDLTSGPDVYLRISRGNTVLHTTNYVQNLSGQHEWVVNFDIDYPTETYSIAAYDYDDGLTDDDFLGGISFVPYLSGQKFPVWYPVTCSGCTVSFQVLGIAYFH